VDFDFDDGALSLELSETLIPSYRRALAFPLYRSWVLADACKTDAARFLLRGTRTVLRCLLELRAILDAHEVYYVYSRIWLDDFCRWIQACARYVMLRKSFDRSTSGLKVLQRRYFDPSRRGRKRPKYLEGFNWVGSSWSRTDSNDCEGGSTGQRRRRRRVRKTRSLMIVH